MMHRPFLSVPTNVYVVICAVFVFPTAVLMSVATIFLNELYLFGTRYPTILSAASLCALLNSNCHHVMIYCSLTVRSTEIYSMYTFQRVLLVAF